MVTAASVAEPPAPAELQNDSVEEEALRGRLEIWHSLRNHGQKRRQELSRLGFRDGALPGATELLAAVAAQ